MPILPRPITTERLMLRPTRPTDAVRAVAIRSAWDVSRNLSRASFPPDPPEIARWFADHEGEWQRGEAYRFAIERDGAMIGVIDLDGLARGEAHLGYWLDRGAWGCGYASEAGAALIRFAVSEVGLTVLRAGHASDNPASGRVLTKLGFLPCCVAPVLSRPRGGTILQCHYVLRLGSPDAGAHGPSGYDRSPMPSFGRLLMSAPLTDDDLPMRGGQVRNVEF